jgi:hypothetical protein
MSTWHNNTILHPGKNLWDITELRKVFGASFEKKLKDSFFEKGCWCLQLKHIIWEKVYWVIQKI